MKHAPPEFYTFITKTTMLDLHAMTLTSALTKATDQASTSFVIACMRTAHLLRCAADGPVYFVEGQPYSADMLSAEFPEFTLFRLPVEDMFVESDTCRGIWTETARFADLRCLAPLRREFRRLGICRSDDAAVMIQALLGF